MKTSLAILRKVRFVMGFSLVEVTLAIGIASFFMTTIFALLPLGLTCSHNANEQTAAVGVASLVAADLRNAPSTGSGAAISPLFQYHLNNSGLSAQFMTEEGKAADSASSAHYRANVWLTPPASNKKAATIARILITWPAMADPDLAAPPSHYSGSLETILIINRN